MKLNKFLSLTVLLATLFFESFAQTASLNLDIDHAKVKVSPTLYGLMTEEINHSYDGGLYGELIRNRVFKDNTEKLEAWSLLETNGGHGSIKLVGAYPFNVPGEDGGNAINDALTTCLQLTIKDGGDGVGIVNVGYLF